MTLVLSRLEDAALWDSELHKSPQANVFCTSSFLGSLGCRYRLYMVQDGGIPLLGCPVILNEDGTVRETTHPYSMYLGPWFTAAFDAMSPHSQVSMGLEATGFLLASLEREFQSLHFDSHWLLPDLRSFSWFHYGEPSRFQIELVYSGVIDFASYSDFPSFVAALRKDRKRSAKGLTDGAMSIEALTDSGRVGEFLSVYRSTFERQNISLSEDDCRLVESITRAALNGGYGTLYMCRRADGRLASSALFMRDKRTSYYQFGANDPECRDLPGGTLVVLAGIRDAMKDGLRFVDMVGMNSPARGSFKASFNAVPKPCFSMTWRAGAPAKALP